MNKKMPRVSIIVPVYNSEDTVAECLHSVLRQTMDSIEILAIDDGSIDGSSEICRQLASEDGRIRYIRQENRGVAEARLRGIREAAGEYIGFVDSDDVIEPNMYADLTASASGQDMVSSGYYVWYENSKEEKKTEDGIPEGSYAEEDMEYIWENLIYLGENRSHRVGMLGILCNKLLKRELLLTVAEKLDKNPYYRQVHYGEDGVLLYHYVLCCRSVRVLHRAYYHYRMRGGSQTHSVDIHFLRNINDYYLSLLPAFREHKASGLLIPQLEERVCQFAEKELCERMGFGLETRRCKFILPFSKELEGKRIALYGAGKVGMDYSAQLARKKQRLCLWVDKNEGVYREKGVKNPKVLMNLSDDYDLLLIAIKDEASARQAMAELRRLGIPEEKLFWKAPLEA